MVSSPAAGAPSQAVPPRAWRWLAVRVAGSAILLTVLLVVLPFDQLAAAFRRIPGWMWPAAVGIYLTLHLLGALKWRLMANAAGAEMGIAAGIRFYYAGLFGNTFLPSIIGGDVVRAGLALRHVRSRTGLLLGSVVERALDFAALAVVAGLGVLLMPSALDPRSRRVWYAAAAALAIAAAVAAAIALLVPARRFPFRQRRKLARLRQAFRSVGRRPDVLVTVLLLGVGLQGSLVVLTAWLGQASGLDAPLRVWLFVWPLAKMSGILPVTQGGLGVREAAQAALFAPFGVPAVLAVAVSLVFQAVIISGGLIGGLISLVMGRAGAGAAREPVRRPVEVVQVART